MNIFWLDEEPEVAARYHCDKHITKMCIEYAQILSTAAYKCDFFDPSKMYEPVPNINPRVHEWASESWDNYVRLLKLAKGVGKEYSLRYGGSHESIEKVVSKINIAEVNIEGRGFTDPPLCMPDEYKCDNYVDSYRKYYIHGKDWRMSWFNRDVPEWYYGEVQVYD